VNPQDIAKWQLIREQHKWLGVVKIRLGLISEANELNTRVPTEYHEFFDFFEERIAYALPPHYMFGHAIDLTDSTEPP
jgi:hypothetical protein